MTFRVHLPRDPSHLSSDEVLGLGVVTDDRGRRLLGLVLPLGVLADVHADAVGLEQLGHLGVVLEVWARRIAPRIAAAAVLLPEQSGQRRPVLAGKAPLLADAAVPQ